MAVIYRALYRKWRPQKFSEVVGQEAITTALVNQIEAERVGHAYLFTGTRGTGKTTCAKIFAKAVNCENPSGAEPCGQCEACLGIDNGSILDVTEIDAASNNGVDDVRDLRDETAYRPSYCQYKVYIIDEVHMLSGAAFNALLKIMEEPPSHVIFILATTEIHKVPATILSRCQRFDFMRIPAEKMAARLLEVAGNEGIELTDGAADLIARLADGALRDALSLLDTCAGVGEAVDEALVRRMAGVADKSYLFSLSDAVNAGDHGQILELLSSLRSRSIDVRRLCEELIFHYRGFLLAAARPDGSLLDRMPLEERAQYIEAAPQVGEAFAIRAVRRLAAALDRMARSPDPAIELELALFDLASPEGTEKPSENTEKMPATAAPPAGKQTDSPAAREKALAPKEPKEEETIQEEVPQVPNPEIPPEKTSENPKEIQEKATEISTSSEPAMQEGIDGMERFAPWAQVVESMAETDRMLYSYMKGSSAYTDGKRVLIDGGEMFLSYMREYNEASEKIKKSIEQVTGRRYGIGPYTPPEGSKSREITAQDTLRELEAKGIPIEYEG